MIFRRQSKDKPKEPVIIPAWTVADVQFLKAMRIDPWR